MDEATMNKEIAEVTACYDRLIARVDKALAAWHDLREIVQVLCASARIYEPPEFGAMDRAMAELRKGGA